MSKRALQEDLDSPAPKKRRANTMFTIKQFMADFPPMRGPHPSSNESPLPTTVLTNDELQDSSKGRKPPLRSTFNIGLPIRILDQDDDEDTDAPFDWMKAQYSHCIIPELGEEFDFAFDSVTFHRLRDLHNARVRIRDGEFLPDYMITSIATRWISLEEKDRPASDGYLANGEAFVAPCLPFNDINDTLEKYFETEYTEEPSAQYYIPRSKYSVHFVGKPRMTESKQILAVDVGSVLIRNTRTGNVVHIDTGPPKDREERNETAGQVLKAWLEFQKRKCPKADLGPISGSVPMILEGVDRETHSTHRSIHAPVSASLFLRRRVLNWGDMKAFQLRGKPSSKAMGNYVLNNISGWLGLKSSNARRADPRVNKLARSLQSFERNYSHRALYGREQPAPVSQRIATAKKGEAPVYNKEASQDDDASDHEGSRADSTIDGSHKSVSDDEDTVIPDQPKDDYELPDDEASEIEDGHHDEPEKKASTKRVSFELPNDEASSSEDSNGDEAVQKESTKKGSHKEPEDEASNNEYSIHHEPVVRDFAKEVSSEEPNDQEPNDEHPDSKKADNEKPSDEESSDKGPANEDLTAEKSDSDGAADAKDDEADGMDEDTNSSASA